MKKALITGISGFAGSHLSDFLLTQDIEIHGFCHPNHPTTNIDHIKDKVNLIPVDLLKNDLTKIVRKIDPDYVFHLAAFSSPAKSFKNPQTTLNNNIISQLKLLEALVKVKSKAKILIVGSADEYGNVSEKDLPIKEETALSPISPYAVSKVAQDLLGLQFFLHHKLNVIRVRPFNHIGPRQSSDFVVSAFASQIAKIEKSQGGELRVGNLNSWRDFTDVRDMVRAYFFALNKCVPPEVYNIGSGKPVEIRHILEELVSLSKVKITITVNKKLYRPVDIKKIYCDFTKFKKQTGWKPKIPLAKTLSDTIEYERQKIN